MEIWSVVYTRYDKDGNEMYIDTHVFASKEQAEEAFNATKKGISFSDESWWNDEDESDTYSITNDDEDSKATVEIIHGEFLTKPTIKQMVINRKNGVPYNPTNFAEMSNDFSDEYGTPWGYEIYTAIKKKDNYAAVYALKEYLASINGGDELYAFINYVNWV